MNLQELYELLKAARDRIKTLGVQDPAYYDLVIQAAQLKKEIALASFDVDKDIEAVTVADLSKLRELTKGLAAATSAEQVQPGTAGLISGIARVALRSFGIGGIF